MRIRAGIAGFFAAFAVLTVAHATERQPSVTDAALFDAQGYRTARYRSPIRTDPVADATITLDAALGREPGKDALFIDVMPVEAGERDPASGVWQLSAPHLTIPGDVWYHETGRAPVDQALWRALEAKIAEARRSAPGQPVILFCRADCWMSWNAARRLAAQGYANIHWFAAGTDGWHAAGRELVGAIPVTTPGK